MARVESVVGNCPPPRSLIGLSISAGSEVAAGEPQVASRSGTRPASDQGISSAIRIQGSMIELSSQVNKQPVKALVDSGATGNFITNDLVDTWQLLVELETQH